MDILDINSVDVRYSKWSCYFKGAIS